MKKFFAGLGWSLAMPLMMAPANRHRKTLGCKPFRDLAEIIESDLVLLPVSPVVAPARRDWAVKVRQTGYWNPLLSEYKPDPDLLDFLDRGEAPVVISLGVMSLALDESTKKAAAIILAGIKKSGVHAVVQGWNGLVDRDQGESIFVAGSVPHAWLFDRASAVVHHGGFGTTAWALTAGKPALVIPHLIDQFEWGNRVFELGAGPRFLPRYDLTTESFEKSFRDLLENTAYAEGAGHVRPGDPLRKGRRRGRPRA